MTKAFFKELKALRESNNIEISEISERTKINPVYFEGIEKGDFSVLPTVYMRLFIRSYAIEIGADPVKALEDYELYTTGKVSEKIEIKVTAPEESEAPVASTDEDVSPFEFRKKIIWGVAAVIALLILIKFVLSLIDEQRTDINPDQENPVEQQEVLSDNIEPEAELQNLPVYSELPPQSQRTESRVYAREKSTGSKAIELPTSAPFKLRMEALARTKIHFSTLTRSLANEVVEAGTVREFDFADTLRFDLWSAQHVEIFVNDVNISGAQYLSNDDVAVRASIVNDGSLSAEFFRH